MRVQGLKRKAGKMRTQKELAEVDQGDLDRVAGMRLQTVRRSYAQILAGDEPWYPLGNFMHQFFGAYKHFRADLVHDAIEVPEELSVDQWRWAVFCAASVDYLCQKYDLPVPAWSLD